MKIWSIPSIYLHSFQVCLLVFQFAQQLCSAGILLAVSFCYYITWAEFTGVFYERKRDYISSGCHSLHKAMLRLFTESLCLLPFWYHGFLP